MIFEFASIDFLRKPIFNNTEIPVPHCSETYPAQPLVGEVCNVNEVFLFNMIMIIYYENDNMCDNMMLKLMMMILI